MRLRIFGIPKILLMFLGFLPALLWCAFHLDILSCHEKNWSLVVGSGFVISAIFTYFFSRGFFGVRFGILLLAVLIFSDAFISAMMERDFLKLAIALACFAVSAFLFFWLEKRVRGADLNPNLSWFEGDPKFLPSLEAKLKVGEVWESAQVRVIDRNGFFAFLETSAALPPKKLVSFELSFKNTVVLGESRLNAHFIGAKSGFGLQFLPKDLYHFSQYTALVERLKGEGL
jgi:hypothetical protein